MAPHDLQTTRGLILPVGISSAPVTFTLKQLRPDYIGLVGTPDSEPTMDQVFAEIPTPPHRVRHETVSDSPEQIGNLVSRVYDLYHWMRFDKGLEPHEIAIDPTPGRKWMSAGVARLYRAFEAVMQCFPRTEYDIDASDPRWETRPVELRQAAEQACRALPEKIGCVQGWHLLRAWGHPAADAAFAPGRRGRDQLKLEGLLQDRNMSVLAHGWKPIDANRARKMLEQVERLLEAIEPEQVVRWRERLAVPQLPSSAAQR